MLNRSLGYIINCSTDYIKTMKTFFNISDSKAPDTKSTLSLEDLRDGESALVDLIRADCSGLIRRRLLDLGFVPGTRVVRLGKGIFNGPTRFGIRGNIIALRSEQASHILAKSA